MPPESTDSQRGSDARRHVRRILVAFAVIVVLLPGAALGGAWTLILVPLVLVAAVALREALRLRRWARSRPRDAAAPGQ